MAAGEKIPSVGKMIKTGTSGGSPMLRLTTRLQRHRWWVVGLWLAVALVAIGAGQLVGPAYRNDISLPGTESQQVLSYLEAADPRAAGETISIVAHDPNGLAMPATRERVEAALDRVREVPHVLTVTDPYVTPGALSADRTIGYSTVQLDQAAVDLSADTVTAVITTAQAAAGESLQIELAGDAVRSAEGGGGGPAEGVGLLAAMVILVLMFGSVLAAGLPLITAIFAVGSTLGVVSLVSHLVTVPDYVAPLMVLVGLGVGIDYSLLIFARFRNELLGGADRDAATRTALDTAGRSVLFAGAIVMIALLGLLTLGLGSLQGIALGVALTVLVTMIASLTLLPALLSIVGQRLERSIRRHAERVRTEPGRRWRWWAAFVGGRPWLSLIHI